MNPWVLLVLVGVAMYVYNEEAPPASSLATDLATTDPYKGEGRGGVAYAGDVYRLPDKEARTGRTFDPGLLLRDANPSTDQPFPDGTYYFEGQGYPDMRRLPPVYVGDVNPGPPQLLPVYPESVAK